MPQVGSTIQRTPEYKAAIKADRVQANKAKNSARKDGKTNGSLTQRVNGKRLRKLFGGAFGKAPRRTYEQCMMGTSVLSDARSDVPHDKRDHDDDES